MSADHKDLATGDGGKKEVSGYPGVYGIPAICCPIWGLPALKSFVVVLECVRLRNKVSHII